MAVNVHIAANYLTSHGFALATAMSVAVSLNLSLSMSALVGRAANTVAVVAGLYSVVQKAADCAQKLHFTYPVYYCPRPGKNCSLLLWDEHKAFYVKAIQSGVSGN